VPSSSKKPPKKKSKRSHPRELEVITDEDISTVSEVSPGVFVDGFDQDRISAYMRGDPDELDVLVCHMEDLFAQRKRATGDDKKHSEIDAAIERLKDVPVQTWSFGKQGTGSEELTYRSLERGGAVPRCGVSAAEERARAGQGKLPDAAEHKPEL